MFWEFIGTVLRGILLVSTIWVLVVTLIRWKELSRGLRVAGLSPTVSVLGLVAVISLLDHARPYVKLYVAYQGAADEMCIDVTTRYGSEGGPFKRGEARLVSEGRGFPDVLNVAWGTNYTRQFSKAFDLKGKIPRFGATETLRLTVTDSDPRLDIGSETGGPANGSPPIRAGTNQTFSTSGFDSSRIQGIDPVVRDRAGSRTDARLRNPAIETKPH